MVSFLSNSLEKPPADGIDLRSDQKSSTATGCYGCIRGSADPNRNWSVIVALAETLVEEGTTALFELSIHCGPTETFVVICRFHSRW